MPLVHDHIDGSWFVQKNVSALNNVRISVLHCCVYLYLYINYDRSDTIEYLCLVNSHIHIRAHIHFSHLACIAVVSVPFVFFCLIHSFVVVRHWLQLSHSKSAVSTCIAMVWCLQLRCAQALNEAIVHMKCQSVDE